MATVVRCVEVAQIRFLRPMVEAARPDHFQKKGIRKLGNLGKVIPVVQTRKVLSENVREFGADVSNFSRRFAEISNGIHTARTDRPGKA
jgi:hypothetical protein